MNNAIYLLKGTIHRTVNKEANLLEINEVFKNENLLEARKQAFSKFRSYVDVFLDSVGKEYSSHRQAVRDLKAFVKSTNDQFALNNPDLGKMDAEFDKGLFLYLVTDATDIYITKEGETIYNSKIPVYFFSSTVKDDEEILYNGLAQEYLFYNVNNLFKNEPEKSKNTIRLIDFEHNSFIIKGDYDVFNNDLSNGATITDLLNSL